jgi:signal transduction histidine kinase
VKAIQLVLPRGAEEIARFTEAIDQAMAETVPIYAQSEAQYRDRFLAILGHDLRNPLNAILLSATALAGGNKLDEKQLGAVWPLQLKKGILPDRLYCGDEEL